ncbi:Gfo/Idh/MocA family oxidoreductase [Actinoallomurus vinaceus]|uniref:Gfo/Idh/MocA family oxidoreductase n=1 Tax=Actinoallomurus vinaceus TaxID=1080074 RepID=A0ABP8UUP9_9ACTN
MSPLRIGVLGAARIVPMALIKPARQVPDVEIAAIAARDRARAEKFAAKHGIGTVHDSYDALLADDRLDAIYVPLPNGLHAPWTVRALEAGRHVLCEKPFTANAEEARQVADAAARTGRTVMEAFHYRYHPLAERMREIVTTELGRVRHVETAMCFPLPRFSDIRYRLDLAGGATMDAGCYAIHCLRLLGPGTPEVTDARALLKSPGIDRAMTATFAFAEGATGRITTSLWSRTLLRISAKVVGERATMTILNPFMPHFFHRLKVTVDGRTRREKVAGDATYTHQLRAFAAAVAGDPAANLTPPEDAVVTMGLIDDIYRAAGLGPRGDAQRSSGTASA